MSARWFGFLGGLTLAVGAAVRAWEVVDEEAGSEREKV